MAESNEKPPDTAVKTASSEMTYVSPPPPPPSESTEPAATGNSPNSAPSGKKESLEALLAKSQKAQDIKIYVIPYFLKIYEKLFEELDSLKNREKVEGSNQSEISSNPITESEVQSQEEKSVEAVADEPPPAAKVDKFVDKERSSNPVYGFTEPQIQEMIDFVHQILLDLNMYANPEYLDRLYHVARLLGLNIFENFKFGSKKPKSASEPGDTEMGSKIFMNAYKIGSRPNPDDDKNPIDEYETVFRVEPYGMSAAKRTTNLFKYVFNAKKPFKQKHIPLPVGSQELGLTKDSDNKNIWLLKSQGIYSSPSATTTTPEVQPEDANKGCAPASDKDANVLDSTIDTEIAGDENANSMTKEQIKAIMQALCPNFVRAETGFKSRNEFIKKSGKNKTALIDAFVNLLKSPDLKFTDGYVKGEDELKSGLVKLATNIGIDEQTLQETPATTTPSTAPKYKSIDDLKNAIVEKLESFKIKQGGAPPQMTYRYLDDSILCRHFEDCVEESVESCKVHLCVFSIDHSCSLNGDTYPFLKFIVRPQPKDKPDIYEFISFSYDVPDNDSTEDFKCALYENLLTELDLSLTTDSFECASASQILDSVYKGIKSEEIDGQPHVFAFFDFDAILSHSSESPVLGGNGEESPISDKPSQETVVSETNGFVRGTQFPADISDDNLSTPYRWAVIDELLFERKLYGIHGVDPVIPVMFYKNNILWSIFKGESETPVDFPFSVYSVTIKETEDGNERFDNVRVPVDQQTADLRQESVVLPPEIDVYGREDEYGNRFCFTYRPFLKESEKDPKEEPEEEEENKPVLPKRYAVITSNPVYLESVASSPPLKEGGGDQEEYNADSETKSTEDIDSESFKKLAAPVIYFVANNEYTDSKPVVMWGIKQSSQFVAL